MPDSPVPPSLPELTYDELRTAVAGAANMLRSHIRLQAAAGPSAKTNPPTFAGAQGADQADMPRYLTEKRLINGETVNCIVYDTVASQANRCEQAQLDAYADDRIEFPFVQADFSGAPGGGLDYHGIRGGMLSSLETPHRVADAVFRDCAIDGVLFRQTPEGRSLFASSPLDATAMYRAAPHVLILGEWDSHGGDASRGHKFARLVTSEIVAVNAVPGAGSSSRIDPMRFEKAPIYQADPDKTRPGEPDWTVDADKARLDAKNQPVQHRHAKTSELGLGNITPTVDVLGGATFEYAEQTTVIALNQIRCLRFPQQNPAAATAARTALAALALAGAVLRDAQGHSLRSGCDMVAESAPEWELADGFGQFRRFAAPGPAAVCALVAEAATAAAAAGLGWNNEPLTLTPSEALRQAARQRKQVLAGA